MANVELFSRQTDKQTHKQKESQTDRAKTISINVCVWGGGALKKDEILVVVFFIMARICDKLADSVGQRAQTVQSDLELLFA